MVVESPWPSAELFGFDHGVRRDGSGRIYFAGRCRLCPVNDSFRPYLLRLSADGDPDPAFDGDGWAILPVDLGA